MSDLDERVEPLERIRRGRHLAPGETSGPRRMGPASARPVIVVVSEVDDATQASLVRMGLATPAVPEGEKVPETERRPFPMGVLRRA